MGANAPIENASGVHRTQKNLDQKIQFRSNLVSSQLKKLQHLCKLSCNTKYGDIFVQKPSASGGVCPGSPDPPLQGLGPLTPYQGLGPGPNWGRALRPYAPKAKNISRRLWYISPVFGNLYHIQLVTLSQLRPPKFTHFFSNADIELFCQTS